MELTIKSRKLNKEFTFFSQGNRFSYIFVNTNGKNGSAGEQLFSDGSAYQLKGQDDRALEDSFKKECRHWYRNVMIAYKEIRYMGH